MLAHQRRRRLGAQERPGEVDGEHPVPVLVGGLQQRREHRDAGIVDQRIEPAEAPLDGMHRAATASASETSQASASVSFGLGQRRDRALQQFALDIEQRDAPAIGEKAFRHRKPDAARGAGDQRDFLRGRGHG